MSFLGEKDDGRRPSDSPGVYLASRFGRRDEMRMIAQELGKSGILVTSRWLNSPAALTTGDLDPAGPGGQLAAMDLEDLRRSDFCLAFTEEPGHPSPGRGGRHAELGIAVGLGLQVVLIGPREHVFHALPAIRQFPNWNAARDVFIALLQPEAAFAAS